MYKCDVCMFVGHLYDVCMCVTFLGANKCDVWMYKCDICRYSISVMFVYIV